MKYFVLIFVLCSYLNGYSQTIDNILRHKSIEEIRRRIQEFEAENRNSDGVLYLKAIIELDGKKAVDRYEQLMVSNPRSAYADDAKFKIGQYYYSLGLYRLAREQFQELVIQYPNSPLQEDAAYYAILALMAMDQNQLAIQELQQFQKEYPRSALAKLVISDLNWLSTGGRYQAPPDRPELIPPPASTPKEIANTRILAPEPPLKGKFSIQIGAYLRLANAQQQKAFFEKLGYQVLLFSKEVYGQKLNVVCINTFATREQAIDFGKTLNQKHQISYQVIQLE
ncbi:tetratricopeptide repeat protein [candidate division KSB1 bacterium]|nr:tetratricopeptide repeat protein [candidate division KSB1 bacterium]